MANIGFKYGTLSNLSTLIGTTRANEAGTFYVANDANRVALADPSTGLVGWVNGVVYQKALLSSYMPPTYPAGTIVVINGSTSNPSEDGVYITDGEGAVRLDNVGNRLDTLDTKFTTLSTTVSSLTTTVSNLQTTVNSLPTINTTLSTATTSVTVTSGVAAITHTITDTSNNSATASFNITGTEGVSISATGNTITITGGASGIIENIQDYVDEALADALGDLDAMKFKGAITPTAFNDLSDSTFESGWAYKFTADGTLSTPSVTVKTGDMVIMSQNGNNNWIYNIIPSGDDTDIYFQPDVTDATLSSSILWKNNTNHTIAEYQMKDGPGVAMNVTTTSATVAGEHDTRIVSFGLATVTAPTIPSGDYISSLTFDDYGRVSGVTKATLPTLNLTWGTF